MASQNRFVPLDFLLLLPLSIVGEFLPEVSIILLVRAKITRCLSLGSFAGSDALETLQAHHNQQEETVGANETNRTVGWREHGLVPLADLALVSIEVCIPHAQNQDAEDRQRHAEDEVH